MGAECILGFCEHVNVRLNKLSKRLSESWWSPQFKDWVRGASGLCSARQKWCLARCEIYRQKGSTHPDLTQDFVTTWGWWGGLKRKCGVSIRFLVGGWKWIMVILAPNVLKHIELYDLNWWLLWYMNYSSIKLFLKAAYWVLYTEVTAKHFGGATVSRTWDQRAKSGRKEYRNAAPAREGTHFKMGKQSPAHFVYC